METCIDCLFIYKVDGLEVKFKKKTTAGLTFAIIMVYDVLKKYYLNNNIELNNELKNIKNIEDLISYINKHENELNSFSHKHFIKKRELKTVMYIDDCGFNLEYEFDDKMSLTQVLYIFNFLLKELKKEASKQKNYDIYLFFPNYLKGIRNKYNDAYYYITHYEKENLDIKFMEERKDNGK